MESIESGSFETNWSQVFTSFDDLGLRKELLRGVYAMGFEKPSAIQQYGIKPIVEGRDTIAQAHSGTGKTATFSIATLEKVDITKKVPQALILAPTRELAGQSKAVLSNLARFMSGLSVHCAIGGTPIDDDIAAFHRGVHIVVGTPGRINDLIRREVLTPATIELIILDEADEMLSRGFSEQIYDIFKSLSSEVQACLISATMPSSILEMTSQFMRDPVQILVKREVLTLEGIRQFHIDVDAESWKIETLLDIYKIISVQQSVIFCNTRTRVEQLVEELKKQKFTVVCIHGEMEQRERDAIMREFRSGTHRVLVATDLIARGIDVQNCSLVINFDIPKNKETYIHRIGRSGRFGRKGIAINFITRDDAEMLKEIERHYETEIPPMPENISSLL
ncbi:Eukaryotic initiation factor 4A [Aduncisulcus paluster]|uniref:RNA helicase n=1 Tax=Aduncisulcus paluster TaxID=2918883 RepID=A0ABQ5KQR5_9EUKA|nr:Eukaryotic initiation factor 4A [Aduncisulcus paluster]|eukprot:gnl/Carplike_NY0171/215_a312_3078.p1 GENE.gnl/Carplike_NY0171/215_a312_3078~~gnl/Carplike_NY0171/215_a312_3078.p1  ORF type:complete len:393 (+),score=119.09 gnl/Carplike_NY0171/215_a312_3078:1-1179(+)